MFFSLYYISLNINNFLKHALRNGRYAESVRVLVKSSPSLQVQFRLRMALFFVKYWPGWNRQCISGNGKCIRRTAAHLRGCRVAGKRIWGTDSKLPISDWTCSVVLRYRCRIKYQSIKSCTCFPRADKRICRSIPAAAGIGVLFTAGDKRRAHQKRNQRTNRSKFLQFHKNSLPSCGEC